MSKHQFEPKEPITNVLQKDNHIYSIILSYLIDEDIQFLRIVSKAFSYLPGKRLDLLSFSLKHGYLSCAKYTFQEVRANKVSLCYSAADAGSLDCLKFLISQNCVMGEKTAEFCIKRGGIKCLKFIYSIKNSAFKASVSREAARVGDLTCLKYAHQHGAKLKDCDLYAAMSGSVDCLRYVTENSVILNMYVIEQTAVYGNLECMIYAHENKYKWSPNTCASAARNGHLECLKYAHENGAVWGKTCCPDAAATNNLDCLKYAHENGCPWDESTTSSAAFNGNLECLIYSRESGCPWSEYTCMGAVNRNNLSCLKYARENGCEWNSLVCATARSQKTSEILEYIHITRCPMNYCRLREYLDILDDEIMRLKTRMSSMNDLFELIPRDIKLLRKVLNKNAEAAIDQFLEEKDYLITKFYLENVISLNDIVKRRFMEMVDVIYKDFVTKYKL